MEGKLQACEAAVSIDELAIKVDAPLSIETPV